MAVEIEAESVPGNGEVDVVGLVLNQIDIPCEVEEDEAQRDAAQAEDEQQPLRLTPGGLHGGSSIPLLGEPRQRKVSRGRQLPARFRYRLASTANRMAASSRWPPTNAFTLCAVPAESSIVAL